MNRVLQYLQYRANCLTPAWFAMTMGVGITSSILYNFPYPAQWLKILGIVFYALNVSLFLTLSALLAARFILFPSHIRAIFTDPAQSNFFGCFPMGLATLILMTHYIWGQNALTLTITLWWIDVALSLLCAWGLIFIVFAKQKHEAGTVNATMLLPVVTLVVASNLGAVLSKSMPVGLQQSTLVVCFMLWANGEALAFAIMTIYIWRLIYHKLVDKHLTFTAMLPIGPLGQGACSILNQAESMVFIVGKHEELLIKYTSRLTALFLLSFAAFWMAIVVLTVLFKTPERYTMSWWGLTFPLGTWVTAWAILADQLDSNALRVTAAVFATLEVLLTIICLACSFYYGVIRSDLFDTVAKASAHYDEKASTTDDLHATNTALTLV